MIKCASGQGKAQRATYQLVMNRSILCSSQTPYETAICYYTIMAILLLPEGISCIQNHVYDWMLQVLKGAYQLGK